MNQRYINVMRKRFFSMLMVAAMTMPALAQMDRVVQNRPYTDLRPLHFGVFVGTHLQDIEFVNVGPQMVQLDDGTMVEKLISCDQDRWDPGFNVGVLGEVRLTENFQFRLAPAMYFGTRHITFRNHTDLTPGGKPTEVRQDIKTAYVSAALDLIFAAPRFNNYRPYLVAGVNPMINLSAKDNDYLKLNRTDVFVELGAGCDFYLPFFKLRPELKFMYGLTNSLDTDHSKHLKDNNMRMYTESVNKARCKMFVLTFYFE